jgi:hypothetical protein
VDGIGNPKSIAWDHLGKEAQKQYSGEGIGIVPSAEGAHLRAIFQALEGDATANGLWLKSTVGTLGQQNSTRFRIRAQAIGRVGTTAASFHLTPQGVVQASGELAAFVRPGLTEEYTVSMDGVRQDFVIAERPAGDTALHLSLEVTGARVEAAGHGVKLTLDGSGREIAYSRLKVTDATGRQLTARMEVPAVGDDRLAVVVDDIGAVYPVRIDPTFSAAAWISMGGVPGADSDVFAMAVDKNGNLYIGGSFWNVANIRARCIAKWNGSTWSALGAGTDLPVYALDVSGNDVYAGGEFTEAGGVSAKYVAKWDGSTWSALGNGPEAVVNTLAISGTTLYASGESIWDGSEYSWPVSKWNGNNWSVLGSGMDSRVNALAVSGTTLYAGGDFNMAGGVSAQHIAKWNGTQWRPLGEGVQGAEGYHESDICVRALAVSGSSLYVGGYFATAGDSPAKNIAKWNGSKWSALGMGLDALDYLHGVHTLVVAGSKLFAGGSFTVGDDLASSTVAQWNGAAWSALDAKSPNGVRALAISGGSLYAGGYFFSAGDVNATNIAKWDAGKWSALATGTNGEVRAFAVIGSDLYVGGFFKVIGGFDASGIAKWNGSAWSSLGGGCDGVLSMAAYGTDLYVAGYFTAPGGTNATKYIAKWANGVWSDLGTGPNGTIYTLAFFGNQLYAGGYFVTSGEVLTRNIAKWDGSTWSAVGSGLNDGVFCLAASDSYLYAGGYFTQAGAVNTNHIGQWDGNAWSGLGSGLDAPVWALAVSGRDVYAGGSFQTAGGTSANCIAKWNGVVWTALGTGITGLNAQSSSIVFALAVSGTDLYVAGNFGAAGGVEINSIAKWDGSAWSALGSGTYQSVRAVAKFGPDIFAGGIFSDIGGVVSAKIARFGIPPPLSVVTAPLSKQVEKGGSFVFNVIATGDDLTYQWRRNGVDLANQTGPMLVLANIQEAREGRYDVVIRNSLGAIVSAPAYLTIASPLNITLQPVDATLQPGENTTFTVTASGPGTLKYQWSKNGMAIPNGKTATLPVSAVDASAAGLYAVTVSSGSLKVTSRSAQLKVTDPGLLIYHLTGTGNSIEKATTKPTALVSTLILDRTHQRAGLIWITKDGSINTFATEVRENLHTHSTGPVPKSQTVVTELEQSGIAPDQDQTLIWLSGADSLIALSKTRKTIAPRTLKGLLNSLTFTAVGTRIETTSLTAVLDLSGSAEAHHFEEGVEQTLDRLAKALRARGYVTAQSSPD